MNKGHALGLAGVAVLAAAGGAGWLASVVYRPTPLPLVGVPKSEAVDPDAPGSVFVSYLAPAPGTALSDLVAEADAVLTVILTTNRVDRVETRASPSHAMPYSTYRNCVDEQSTERISAVGVCADGPNGVVPPRLPRHFVQTP
jgi:hypothetical protein